jgi:competence ComEA-like helix-hairpin-helix protein
MVPSLFTPAERRLAALVFTLAALGALARAGRTVSPAVDAWLTEVGDGADTAAAVSPADTGAAAPAPAPVSARGSRRREPAPAADAGPIDPNRADYDALLRLPGVGPVLARRILDDRARNGPYRTVDDLRRVSGIGPATLDRLRPRLAVGDGPGG